MHYVSVFYDPYLFIKSMPNSLYVNKPIHEIG
jgi:hypothetical protein